MNFCGHVIQPLMDVTSITVRQRMAAAMTALVTLILRTGFYINTKVLNDVQKQKVTVTMDSGFITSFQLLTTTQQPL